MEYLHTMVRISNVEESLDFYCNKLGMVEVRRTESEAGRYTNIFLSASGDTESAKENWSPTIELTFNWDPEEYTGGRNFGHLAFQVIISTNFAILCKKVEWSLIGLHVKVGWPSSDRQMGCPSNSCKKVMR